MSAKTSTLVLVADSIFEIVLHDGQRCVPSGKNCLLLLKVVASRPLNFARPEQERLLSLASFSMAFQIILCFIGFPPALFYCLICCILFMKLGIKSSENRIKIYFNQKLSCFVVLMVRFC